MMIPDSLLEKLHHTILELGADYKVESLIEALTQHGIHSDQIIVQAKGTSKRALRKEVSGFHTESLSYDLKEYIFLHTNRDGMYDALPENIFHHPTGIGAEKNKFETIDAIKKHREEEENARKFFLPFEFEFNHLKTLLYSLQEDFEKNTNNTKLINIFSKHWPILLKLDTYHGYIFLRMIPLIHLLRDDFKMIPICINLVLDIKIELTLKKQLVTSQLQESFTMGNSSLGIDTTVGKTIDDGVSDVLVKVGPLLKHQIRDHAPGGKKEGLIEELLDYFLGANYFVYKEFIGNEDINEFVLDSDSLALGVNASL